MKITVLGAGIIGVTTAWELLADGHDVTLVDRQPMVAGETSRANGGQISPSHADPWASPGALWRAVRWMADGDAPLKLTPRLDLTLWSWLARFAANCDSKRHHRNTEAMANLARYSRDRLQSLNGAIKIGYGRRQVGLLHVFRDPKAYAASRAQAERVSDLGVPRTPVSVDECLAIEPALTAIRDQLTGGYHSPDDESGDAHVFATRLANQAKRKGLKLRLNAVVSGLEIAGGRVQGVRLADGEVFEAEAIVCAMGAFSTPFLRDHDIMLPVQPAKGYSITVPAKPAKAAPKVALIDDERKIVVSRLGGKVRIAGMAEFAGLDASVPGHRARLLARHGFDLLPGLRHHDEGETDLRYWAGLRPQTPDGVPVIGPAGIEGLYINCGHGTLGWTMSLGSAKLVADLISGRPTDLPSSPYSLTRF